MTQQRNHHRRGSIYVVTLGAATTVVVIGLAAVTALRIQRRNVDQTGDFVEARLYAQSAIDLGMRIIKTDANWRSGYPNGPWVVDTQIGRGTYSLDVVDPIDDDLFNNAEDSLFLTGAGAVGDARYRLQVTAHAEIPPLSCLEVALHTGEDVRLNGVTLDCDQIISANNDVDSATSTVRSDVEAVNGIQGSGYLGTTTTGITARTMPNADPSVAFQYYTTNGTWIPLTSLQLESSVYGIRGNVLGPGYNPYGPQTDAAGIYVIDCQGSDIHIENSRILGTLVLLNAGEDSAIYNSVSLEAAVANYPALLVSGKMNLIFTNTPLSEADLNTNFNPAGVPDQGETDVDITDTYPSIIKGLVYVGEVRTNTNVLDAYAEAVHITIDGVLVVANRVEATNCNMDLTYQQTFFDQPPPGFTEPPRMVIADGSWKQLVD